MPQHFSILDRLIVVIYFTDSAGNVLDAQTFYSAPKSSLDDKTPHVFKGGFKLPKGTTHIAFGYEGSVLEDGSKALHKKESAVQHGFQHSPFR